MDRYRTHTELPVAEDEARSAVSIRPLSSRRRSRMRRQSRGKRIELSPRDIELFRLLDRYRYLRSTFLYAFLGGNRKRFIERLGDLYHEGYIGRPQQQWQFANARYMPAIYELDQKGEGVLREYGLRTDDSPLLTKGRMGASRQFAHQLMIGDILASIELGVRENPDLRFIDWREILARAPKETRNSANPFRIPCSISYDGPRSVSVQSTTMSLIPDAIFGLEYGGSTTKTYRFFVLEADRATMPVVRKNVEQSSYLKKLLGYRDIAARHLFRSKLGLPNFLVLNVTANMHRAKMMMASLHQLTGGKGSPLFLFRTIPTLGDSQRAPCPTSMLLTEPWERVGLPPFRIDQP